MKPTGKRVLVDRVEDTGVKGSIIIPEKYRSWPQEGIVGAVGSRVTTIHPGDRVLFGKFAGIETKMGLLIWEDDIMAVLE